MRGPVRKARARVERIAAGLRMTARAGLGDESKEERGAAMLATELPAIWRNFRRHLQPRPTLWLTSSHAGLARQLLKGSVTRPRRTRFTEDVMRRWSRAKLGLRVAEVLALTSVVVACGSAGSAGQGNGVGAPVSTGMNVGPRRLGPRRAARARAARAARAIRATTGVAPSCWRPRRPRGGPSSTATRRRCSSTSGVDTAAGTMSAPVATIAKGVQLAQQVHKDSYVCDGTYTEAVVIANTAVNRPVHGGYDCANGWGARRRRRHPSRPAAACRSR